MGTEENRNEAALVCAARMGEREALRGLIERNWGWLKGLVCSMAQSGGDTDDIMQNVCVQVIRKIATLRQPERFRPWLAAVARNEVLRWRRRNRNRPVPLDENAAGEQMDDRTAGPGESIAFAEQLELIRSAVRRLPDKYREVFMLAHSSDVSYARIAQILDIPVTTVQIRLVRARRMVYDLVIGKKVDKVPRT